MADFNKGDLVRLKSGGPLMTVQNVGEYPPTTDGVYCVGFEGNRRCDEVFDAAVLERAQRSSPVGRVERA